MKETDNEQRNVERLYRVLSVREETRAGKASRRNENLGGRAGCNLEQDVQGKLLRR